MDTDPRRFFIALPVDDEKSVQSLMGVSRYLNKNESFLKPVPVNNYHITIKFFGSLEPAPAESLLNVFSSLNHLKKVEYKIEGIGVFPSIDNPSIIWAGLKCDEKPLNEIVQSIEDLALSLGFTPEKRKFVPHLTLARVKKEKTVPPEFKNYLIKEKHSLFSSSVFRELVLFESLLKRTGAEYKKVRVIKL